jgi:hypothetical protein
MNHKLMPISLAQAITIAERGAFSDIKELATSSGQVLKSEYLEAENCWMFFISAKINVPIDATLGIKWAYVVSKKGTFSMVQDFSDDSPRLHAYLQTMSDHFQQCGE